MKENIVHKALEELRQVADIQSIFRNKGPLDGSLEMTINDKKYKFVIDVKRELRKHQLQQIIENHYNYDDFLLISYRLTPKIKEELRYKGIPYIEANGNIFIRNEGLFLFVDTQKPLDLKRTRGNRAFTQTGLKVLFHLLRHPEAINLPQRQIAEVTNVALGNIPQIISGLKETGYLIPLNSRTFTWENRKELLKRWIVDYETVLRPKLKKGRYTFKGNWNEIILKNGTVWGGEPAADILTNHLRPEKFLLYTNENRMDLIKNNKLMPDENGEVEVLEKFWENMTGKTAPELLVYVDLILEGGKRNTETAEMIYNEYVKQDL